MHHPSVHLTASVMCACNVFYDVFSGRGHGFTVCNTSLQQTIDLKQAFEKELFKNNVKVKAYRASNG